MNGLSGRDTTGDRGILGLLRFGVAVGTLGEFLINFDLIQ